MSKIRRLSIRGIRNFGDDKEDSIIRFSCPLTLILGPNGTGKTTIIEALKYATTGEFPPGSDRGKSFIHDPSLATSSTIRGMVKAEIIDSMGTNYTVCRTIESGITKKIKTLDTTVTRINKDKGEKASITNRCADVDAELSLALGISKSILNYVIFCHQEELNWPLDQGKALKDRFDEIFDSTKFNKALENIGKLSKELQSDIRVMNAEKKTYSIQVSEVEAKEHKLEEQEKRLESTKEKINDIDEELVPLDNKIMEIQQFHSEYKNLQDEEEKKKMEYGVHNERYIKLKETIKNFFEGTTEELDMRLQSYDSILKAKNNEITENKVEVENISEKETRVSNILAGRRETVGTLKQQVKDHERRVNHRKLLLNDILQKCGFDTMGPDVSEIEVKAHTKRLEQKMRELEQEIEEKRSTMQNQEKELQKEVDALRSNYSKIESEKLLKEKEVTEIRNEVVAIGSQITQIGSASNKLKSLEQKLEIAKQRMNEVSKALDVDFIKTEIQNKTKLRDETETKLNTVDDEISSLHKLSSLMAEFELNKTTLQAKEEEIENFKSKHGNAIKTLLNVKELQPIKLRKTLECIYQQLDKETNILTHEIQAQERKTTASETTLRHIENEIAKKRTELERNKQKISVVCNYKNFDENLLMQSKIVKNLQDERGIYAYQATAYKEYIKKLSVKNPCCPLCHRNFQEQEKVKDLINEMESDIIRNQPDRLRKCEEELKIQQEKYDNMLQLKPIVEKIIECEQTELKLLEDRLEKTKNKVNQSKASVKNLEASRVEPEKKLSLYKNIVGDIQLWDRSIDDIQQLKKIVGKFQTQITNAGVTSERTIEEAQRERELLRTFFKNTRSYIEALHLKLNKHNERLQNARTTYNELHEEQLQIHSDMQKLKHLKDKQEDLYTREVNVGETVEKLRENLTDAEAQLNSGIQRLEKTKTENWQKQEIDRKSMVESTNRLSDLHKITVEIDSFVKSNTFEKLTNYEREVTSYQDTLTELVSKKKDLEETISKLKKDVVSQDIEKRELLDNITLRKTKQTIEILKEQCKQLSAKLQNMNYDEMKKRWERLEGEKQKLCGQRNIAMGNQQELERTIKQYKQELQKQEYRLARRNYNNKCIELTVREDTINNMKIYCQVLDAAMIEYHEERMSTVNKIMKKLWRHVYKGTDTTSIEIRTEPTEGVGSNRRSYNYKLIQTKHGCDMDMKGRCSAGQKALASIIIRLALAETFCKDCGILALDEPTTNLDEENTDSLANALTKVVEMRSRHQKNFQLIIISHDEKFLQKLANLNNHRRFYELYRKPNGKTTIKISDFDQPTSVVPLVHIKDESDDERRANQPTHSHHAPVASTSNRKRFSWNDSDDNEKQTRKRHRVAE